MFNAICPAIYQQLRKRAGMTQAEFATAIGVSRITVVRFESGRAQPSQEQEEKMRQLAGCSQEELVEMACRQMSELIDRRVAIVNGHGAYEPATALAQAYLLLEEAPDELPAAMVRALHNKIATTQLVGLAFERNNADLVELTRDCRDHLQGDRRA